MLLTSVLERLFYVHFLAHHFCFSRILIQFNGLTGASSNLIILLCSKHTVFNTEHLPVLKLCDILTKIFL